MKDNDLSPETPRRFFVVADVVITRAEETSGTRKFFSRSSTTTRTWTPDLAAMAQLWRWSGSLGLRLELVFLGPDVRERDVEQLWEMLDNTSANAFSDHHWYEDPEALARSLNMRPDVIGIIDKPTRFGAYGQRGTTMAAIG